VLTGALLVAALTACAPDTPQGGATPSGSEGEPSPIATQSGEPSASPIPTVAAQIPTDCQDMLNAAVLAELEGVPLNDPAFGPSGTQPDGSIICVWADPAADTTSLVTTISTVYRGPALDLLNQLADEEDFTCYTPDGGTRCEKTWENETFPVIDGRTLFWRDDILIDTQYSNLAPSGYTDAIVASIWGESGT
jgi:hypothetical protein